MGGRHAKRVRKCLHVSMHVHICMNMYVYVAQIIDKWHAELVRMCMYVCMYMYMYM